jgi:hypothetical protein
VLRLPVTARGLRYRRDVLGRCAAVVTLVAWGAQARGEAPIVTGRTPRAVGRAGVGTVSDDGGGALLVNPAAIARRSSNRLQLGLAFVDDELSYLASLHAPAARDQSSSRLVPMVSFEGAIGDWIVGIAAGTTVRSERALRRPRDILPTDYGNSFEYRYTGLAGSIRRDTLSFAGAYRLTDSVAIGLSLSTSRVSISESRRLWAGDVDRVVFGVRRPDTLGDPAHDVELAMAAVDNFAPTAVAGVLVAPVDSRIELGLSASWSAPARVRGDVASTGSPQTSFAHAQTGGAVARLEVEQPIIVRSGARWLGDGFAAEVGGDLYWFPRRAEATSWQMTGVTITDDTTATAPTSVELARLPSRISSRTHGALRGALDVELIEGFLWATGGYAYATAGTPGARLSPTFGDLGGHTLGLGFEVTTGGFTLTFGWARTWSIKEAEPVSRWRLDNPFETGDGPARSGIYDGSTDMIGVSVDADLDGG